MVVVCVLGLVRIGEGVEEVGSYGDVLVGSCGDEKAESVGIIGVVKE